VSPGRPMTRLNEILARVFREDEHDDVPPLGVENRRIPLCVGHMVSVDELVDEDVVAHQERVSMELEGILNA